jgi:tetratricopeptide (TPR) repeat protein
MRTTRLLLAALLAASVGCAAEDYAKTGKSWEASNSLAAVEYYRLALEADPAQPDALSAVRNVDFVQPALDRADAQGQAGDWVAAVGLLDEAVAIAAVLGEAGGAIDMADLETRHAAALKQAAQQRFQDGETLRGRSKAKEASVCYREALAFDPSHAQAQRLYEEQRDAATQRIAIMPFAANLPDQPNAGRALCDDVTARAMAMNPEFLRFVDRNNLDRLLDELDLNETGLVDPDTAAREGKLMGVSAILMGELTVECVDSGWEHTPKQNSIKKKVDDGKGGKTEQVITADYTVSRRSASARAVVSYRVISAETGEVIAAATDLVAQAADTVSYARLGSGDAQAVPKGERKLLQETEREPLVAGELTRSAIGKLGQVVAKDLVERFQ